MNNVMLKCITHVGCPVDCTAVPLVKGIDVCSSGEQEPHHLTVATEKNRAIRKYVKGGCNLNTTNSINVAARITIDDGV